MSEKKILIVEDEAIVAEDIRRTLEKLGYQVMGVVATGEAAVARVTADRPDLVLMDVVLQGELSGIETAASLRQEHQVPVVYLTAYADPATLERAKLTEPFGYLLKPFKEKDLHTAIEIALYKSRAEARIAHLNAVLRAIRKVNQLIAQERDRERLIQRACELLVENRGYSLAWVILGEPGREVHQTAYAALEVDSHELADFFNGGQLPPGALRLAGSSTGTLIAITEVQDQCPHCPISHLFQGQGALVTSLVNEGRCYGLMGVVLPSSLTSDEEEQSLFEEVASDIALALRNLEMAEALELLHCRQQALLELHQLADAPEEQILDYVLSAVLTTLQSEYAFIGTLDEAEQTMTIHRWSRGAMEKCQVIDYPIVYPVSQAGWWADCIRQRRAVTVNDYQAPHAPKKGLPAGHVPLSRFLAAPVLEAGRVVAVAAVANKATDYDASDARALTTLLERMWEIIRRKRAEEAFQVLVNNSPMGIFIIQDGKFQIVNPGLEKICGYSAEALLGKGSLELVSQEYRREVRRNAIRMLTGDTQMVSEFPLVIAGGQSRWVMSKLVSTVYRGKRAVLGYCMDINERKELERNFLQAQKMEAVGRLAGGVAHDFNNMLGVILGYCDILHQKLKEPDAQSHHVAEIKKAAARAAALTQQLLAFSRKQIMRPQVLNLNPMLVDMEKMLRRLIGEDIELKVIFDPSLGAVRADPGHLEQVIMNLVVNARDAMPHGGKLTVETANVYLDQAYAEKHAFVPPGQYVRLAITDNGLGMDAATQARIFEPFFTTKEDSKGTGLGLSTVYGVVKQNGGYIQVYSEVNRGTTFKIYLPLVQEGVAEATAPTPAQEELHGSETILVVEDEDLVRKLICKILTRFGFTVLEARDGDEALLLVEKLTEPIHLLLTDVVMPQMSGRELADRLKDNLPEIKVLFMSGYTENAIIHHGVIEPELAFIQKPFSPPGLVEKIRKILDTTENPS